METFIAYRPGFLAFCFNPSETSMETSIYIYSVGVQTETSNRTV